MSWSKTTENQANAPNRKNCAKSGLGQNNRKSSKCSKPEELRKEWIGAKQQKIKQMLQTGRIEQRVDWSKTTENQGNAPNRKNYTKSDLE